VSRILAGGLTALSLFCLSGCATTHTEYRADKSVASVTKVGLTHDVVLPSGVRISTNDGVTTAVAGVAFKGIETLGLPFAQMVAEKAAEATLRSSSAPVEPTKGE
jgi:hypothetical protein